MQPAALRQPVFDPRAFSAGVSPAPDHERYAAPRIGPGSPAFAEDAFCAATTQQRISVWTPAAEVLSGYSAGEVVSRSFAILVPPDLDVAVTTIFDRVVGGGTVDLPFALFPRKDGSRVQVAARFSPLRSETGAITGVGVVFRDISQQFCAWEERSKAVRMRALEALAGGLARELGEIASALSTGAHGMRAAASEDGLAQIEGSAARIRTMKRELAAFAGLQALDSRRTVVDHMLTTMSRVLEGAAGPGITLELLHGARGATVFVDPLQLGQALLHLVGNARDNMGGTGSLIIETTVEDSHWPSGAKERVCAVIRVTETGSGLDLRARRRIFEPFVATPAGASGLALGAAYGIVRQSGGHMTVESQPGVGTTYAIYLPANRGPHERTPPRGSHIFSSDPRPAAS